MIGIIGIIASLVVLSLSLLITRIATVALTLTGLSSEAASFQARSAFTGTGFTTSEAEHVVDHPVRRKIIMALMVARSAGFISIIISLILSFGSAGSHEMERLVRLIWLVAGSIALWLLARSRRVERWLEKVIRLLLKRWTDLEVRDYHQLLHLSGSYSVQELYVETGDWLAGKTMAECSLPAEGILVLGIYRSDGAYEGAPTPDAAICPGDTMILYGRAEALRELDERKAGRQGEAEHAAAEGRQRREQETEVQQELAPEKMSGKSGD